MYVCFCAAVTDVEVRACAMAGDRSVDAVGERCEAGAGCGGCREHIAALLAATRPTEEWQELRRTA
ncbi:MAG: (2Fe-2S)-binding protein [Pseudonocardiaceae bacterium]|nr:(2Fe-2S)-binding protein [Pseudonocardiaceae bacterium]